MNKPRKKDSHQFKGITKAQLKAIKRNANILYDTRQDDKVRVSAWRSICRIVEYVEES